jgi:tetratricopeptide (TPR) repeat protein
LTRNSLAARIRTGGLFVLLLMLSGCASLQSSHLSRSAFPDAVELAHVPFFPQEEYHCGPAALATTLSWAGTPTTPDALAPQLYVPNRKGTFQFELVASARRQGAVPYVLRPSLSTLLAEVQAGNPVIVLQNLAVSWYPKWHYAVVVGFDLGKDELILRSGRQQRHVIPLRTFERTWRRGEYWALVTMAPNRLPQTAEEASYLQSVAELERLNRHLEASVAYRAALERWPSSLTAWLGLGNNHYAMGHQVEAETAYRTATEKHPQAADAYNNLAHVLGEQGRWVEAEPAARRAIAIGGPRIGTYQKTLDEILKRAITR